MKRMPAILLLACLSCLPRWLAAAPAGAPQRIAKIEIPAYKTVRLENGLTLFLLERHQLPLVNFHWLMKSGGSICDPAGREGLATFTASLLRKGTATRTADQLSEALDFVGASFGAGAGHEYAVGSAEFVAKDLDLAVDLLSDMLLHPAFPADELAKMIQQEVDGIKEAKDVPGQVIERYYEGLLFGPHLYARPVGGTETSLPKITRDEVASFYQSHYVPNQMLLAVVGDFSATDLEAKLRAKFGGWQNKPVTVLPLQAPPRIKGRTTLLVDKPDATQTFFRFGNIGLARTNADWVPVHVINTLFGGRFTSMINSELRIESGLTYGANSFFAENQAPGAFAIGSFTPNDTTDRALTMALEVLRKLHQNGITAEQLQSAKAYMQGQFGPTLETNDQLASTLCELEFYGLGAKDVSTYFDRIDAMTLADAKRVIANYFPEKDLAFVLIGQVAVIEPVAKKLGGNIKRKSISDAAF